MNRPMKLLSLLTAIVPVSFAVAVPATATVRPIVTGLSSHRSVYWGGGTITVHGENFVAVRKVYFGRKQAARPHVRSASTLTVEVPEHGYGTVHVRVLTADGKSVRTSADEFTFTRPTMNTPIQGGLTARQEQRVSAHVRAKHHGVHTARKARRWTSAMGLTAMRRARSWLGLPYSWAGGNSRGPTPGVCAHNGGDLDCHVVGFDCSGLALYAWAPYKQLVHYAATQHSRAGRFHPAIGELVPGDLVFFSSYIPNGIGHVAIYEGHGWVIQAEQSGYPIMRSRLVDVIAASGHYRGATRPTSTGREGPVPHLSAVTPQLPVKGGYVTLTGSRLAGATSVTIGGTRIYSFASRTSHHLRVKAPAHRAGRVKVTVYNAWGGASRTLTYIGAPRVTSVSPASGPVTGGTPITLSGADLGVATTVTVDGRAVRFAATSATRLTITSPAHAAGAVPIVVSSRYGTAKPVTFTYVAAATPAGRVTRSGAGTGGSSSPPPASPSSSPPAANSPPSSRSSSPPASSPPSSPPASSPSGPPPSGSTVSGSAAAPGSPPG